MNALTADGVLVLLFVWTQLVRVEVPVGLPLEAPVEYPTHVYVVVTVLVWVLTEPMKESVVVTTVLATDGSWKLYVTAGDPVVYELLETDGFNQ